MRASQKVSSHRIYREFLCFQLIRFQIKFKFLGNNHDNTVCKSPKEIFFRLTVALAAVVVLAAISFHELPLSVEKSSVATSEH
jgi:hypothetical protein